MVHKYISKSNFKTQMICSKDSLKKIDVIIESYDKWIDYKFYRQNI